MARKPKDKTKVDPFAFLNDLPAGGPLANPEQDQSDSENSDQPSKTELPAASAGQTKAATSQMSHSEQMRRALDRLQAIDDMNADDADIGLDPTPVTTENLPAVISQAIKVPGSDDIQWHRVSNLPGYQKGAIRRMGRGVFDQFTKTPEQEITTIAFMSPDGQPVRDDDSRRNPNTPAELKTVVSWLLKNARPLGEPDHDTNTQPIPGYTSEARQFIAMGIRFHVVRDYIDGQLIGHYVYAWPERDSKNKPSDSEISDQRSPFTQLRENKMSTFNPKKASTALLEARVRELRSQIYISKLVLEHYRRPQPLTEWTRKQREGRNGTLTRLIGDRLGARKLIRMLHKKHKLSDESIYQEHPLDLRIMWTEFKNHPDKFQIIVSSRGVAGIKPFEQDIINGKAKAAKNNKEYNPARDNTLRYQIVAYEGNREVDPETLRQPTEPGEEPEERDLDPTVMRARGGVPSRRDPRGDNIFDRLREQIGTLENIYIATDAVEREKIKKRTDLKKEPNVDYSTARTQAIARIRPVLLKLAKKIKNEVFQEVNSATTFAEKEKLSKIGKGVDEFITAVNTGGDLPMGYSSPIVKIIDRAVYGASTYRANSTDAAQWLASLGKMGQKQELGNFLNEIRTALLST